MTPNKYWEFRAKWAIKFWGNRKPPALLNTAEDDLFVNIGLSKTVKAEKLASTPLLLEAFDTQLFLYFGHTFEGEIDPSR